MTIDFSSDTYRHADLSALKAHLTERIDMIEQYPEAQPTELEGIIADKLGIAPEGVLLTNDSMEAVYMIAELFRKSASVIPQPTTTEYAEACRIHQHIISYENTDSLTELPKDRIYWICNPNNPSGNVLKKGFVDYIVRRSPRYTFVVDQSYEAYTQEPLLVPREVQETPNLLLIHSISKTYGVPGIPLGYITGNPNTIQLLRNRRCPMAFSNLALETGKYLIEQGQPAITDLEAVLTESERLRNNLRAIEGVRVYETKTSFMLCEISEKTTTDLQQFLAENYDMLIHNCSGYFGLSNYFFRIATQQPEENDTLVAAIREFLETKSEK